MHLHVVLCSNAVPSVEGDGSKCVDDTTIITMLHADCCRLLLLSFFVLWMLFLCFCTAFDQILLMFHLCEFVQLFICSGIYNFSS